MYLDKNLDRKGGKPVQALPALWLKEHLDENGRVDICRYMHPGEFQCTWKRQKPFIGSRLDYFFIPHHML